MTYNVKYNVQFAMRSQKDGNSILGYTVGHVIGYSGDYSIVYLVAGCDLLSHRILFRRHG